MHWNCITVASLQHDAGTRWGVRVMGCDGALGVLDGAGAGLLGHADHYLEKPLRVDQLIETATALIGRGRPLSDDLPRGNLRAWL